MTKTKRDVRQVVFGKKDKALSDWANSRDKNFSSYVKDLIREDMKIHASYDKNELRNIVKSLLNELNIETKPIEVKDKSSLGEKGKKAARNLIKNRNY